MHAHGVTAWRARALRFSYLLRHCAPSPFLCAAQTLLQRAAAAQGAAAMQRKRCALLAPEGKRGEGGRGKGRNESRSFVYFFACGLQPPPFMPRPQRCSTNNRSKMSLRQCWPASGILAMSLLPRNRCEGELQRPTFSGTTRPPLLPCGPARGLARRPTSTAVGCAPLKTVSVRAQQPRRGREEGEVGKKGKERKRRL